MSKKITFRLSDELYELIEQKSNGNKSAWLVELIQQELGAPSDNRPTKKEPSTTIFRQDVLRRLDELEMAVAALQASPDPVSKPEELHPRSEDILAALSSRKVKLGTRIADGLNLISGNDLNMAINERYPKNAVRMALESVGCQVNRTVLANNWDEIVMPLIQARGD